MNFTTEFPFPFVLGGTVEENIARLDDYFFNEKGSGTDLEGNHPGIRPGPARALHHDRAI